MWEHNDKSSLRIQIRAFKGDLDFQQVANLFIYKSPSNLAWLAGESISILLECLDTKRSKRLNLRKTLSFLPNGSLTISGLSSKHNNTKLLLCCPDIEILKHALSIAPMHLLNSSSSSSSSSSSPSYIMTNKKVKVSKPISQDKNGA